MSREMTISIPHQLGAEEATRRLRVGLEKMRAVAPKAPGQAPPGVDHGPPAAANVTRLTDPSQRRAQ
jgi:hypothetical protein